MSPLGLLREWFDSAADAEGGPRPRSARSDDRERPAPDGGTTGLGVEADAPTGFAPGASADGYAVDLVIFEWLTTLIDAAGPAGALRAVDQYERMGWIDADLRSYLESALGGPALDVDVDPTDPGELTVADHERSYEYVRRLSILREPDGDREATPSRERGP